jgi:hypothetical protein
VQVRPKRGRFHNELTRFRYDVTLQLGPGLGPTVAPFTLDWERHRLTVSELRRFLMESEQDTVMVTGVPNRRLLCEAGALERLKESDGSACAGDLREARRALEADGVDPEEVFKMVRGSPYAVDVRCASSGNAACFDVMFTRSESHAEARTAFVGGAVQTKDWTAYANNPLQALFARTLVPELRSFLEARLPTYMMPSKFVVLDRLPLLPNGKINRLALPEPDQGLPRREHTYVAPATDLERVLADIWADVLNVPQVGTRDNFFAELGGHSLLGTQLIAHVQSALRVAVPLRRLFESPTVETFALALLQDPSTRLQIERTAELLVKVAQLSDTEAKAMLSQKRSPGDILPSLCYAE